MNRRAAVAVVATAALVGSVFATAPAQATVPSEYEVTITNVSGGQPFTPPLLAVHKKPVVIFDVGSAASFEIKEIAENGNLAPLIDALSANKHVTDVEVGAAPLVPAGRTGATGFSDSATFTVTGGPGAKYLSWASMLICTNDGFSGLAGIRLPKHVGESVTVSTAGYDAGTETNTEDFADLVPPCQPLMGVSSGDTGTGASDPSLAEGGVIHHHAGILGGDDLLPGVHGWTDPVATISITATG